MAVLVTGGVRSGKTHHAQALVSSARDATGGVVTYLAPGPAYPDDPDWQARIAAHRTQRPAGWRTVEDTDLAGALAASAVCGPVLVDCLGTWLSGLIDRTGLWDAPTVRVCDRALSAVEDALAVLSAGGRHEVVFVTNEVGLGVVPSHASGRVFRDALGTVNQRVAAVCTEVHLAIAGRVLVL